MKKSILKTVMQSRDLFDINRLVREKKLLKVNIKEQDVEFFKTKLLKKEYISSKLDNVIEVQTDTNLTTITKYEGYFLIIECINTFTAFKGDTNYYKLTY